MTYRGWGAEVSLEGIGVAFPGPGAGGSPQLRISLLHVTIVHAQRREGLLPAKNTHLCQNLHRSSSVVLPGDSSKPFMKVGVVKSDDY